MTIEEAIARIKEHEIIHKMDEPRAIYISEALDMAIKALEQQSCKDAISRQAVLEIQAKYAEDIGATKFWQMRDDIKALSSVTPQPKTGHWIDDDGDNAICGCCNHLNHLYGTYCKHCGARMEEVEDK